MKRRIPREHDYKVFKAIVVITIITVVAIFVVVSYVGLVANAVLTGSYI